jgi:hypothetical protein
MTMATHHTAKAVRMHLPAIGMEFWAPALGLGALLSVVQFSYTEFSFVREVLGQNTPEGAAAGWWWSVSMVWLIAALRAPHGKTDHIGRGFRFYVFSAFSLLGVLEIAQQGAPAAMGFLVGAGAFAALYSLADLGATALKRLRRSVRARRAISRRTFNSEAEQLALPFL